MAQENTELEIFALLKHTEPSVPIYRRINKDQRVRIGKRVVDHAFLRVTMMDPVAKKNKTLRLKLNSNSIDQAFQIKEELILANEAFTDAEKKAVEFREGILMTREPIVKEFLKASPQMFGFKGTSPDVKEPLYQLVDKAAEVKSSNKAFIKRVDAALKVKDLYEREAVEEGQELMIRLNGSFFTPPSDIDEIVDQLTKFIDDADDAMLDKMLQKDHTIDEKITILIGKAISEGIISFDKVEGQVVKIVSDDKTVTLREIPSSYPADERKNYFAAFLASEEGKLLKDDLEKLIKEKTSGRGGGTKTKKKELFT